MTPITPQTMYQGKPKKAYQDALQKYKNSIFNSDSATSFHLDLEYNFQ